MKDINNWPVDADGNPLMLVSYCSAEKIPTAAYANVDVGPATATKFTDDFEKGFEECAEAVNKILEVERDKVLLELEKGE